jgi:heme ABC exporter ATP-binding subunit CcmA
MLLANNLLFKRLGKTIFQNLNISLPPKKIIQIKGRNGIGKTTLIKILSHIILPTSGDIFWNAKNILKNSEIFFKNLTLVMDTNTSKKDMTVYENIQFWKGIFKSTIKNSEIDLLLDMLGIRNYKNIFVKNLSYGEIRRLEISRLIIENKKLWILDEPFLGLDTTMVNTLHETFTGHIKKEGMIIFASHYNYKISEVETINLENYVDN